MKADFKVLLAAVLVLVGLAAVFVLVDKSSKTKANVNENFKAKTNADYGENGYGENGFGKNGFGGNEYGENVETYPTTKAGENFAQGGAGTAVATKIIPFDPNTCSAEQLRSIGLSDYSVRAILKYRARGGVYSSPEDFARVPGLTQGLYKRLKPYIRIADDFRPASELVSSKASKYKSSGNVEAKDYPKKMGAGERISLNDADSLTLRRVPGIGPYYAAKIIDLRNRYGGFVSLEQLADIRGLDEECFQYFFIADGGITKININRAGFERLSAHPYIGYRRARKIMDYRRLKGKISSLQQLSLLEGFSEKERARLEPYIEY